MEVTRTDCWSAENATRAYLNTLKMGQMGTEPNAAEFISALAAGNNARNMMMACSGAANPIILLALLAAAHQTGGQVACILQGTGELILSKKILGHKARNVHFVIGDPRNLLSSHYRYKEADFVLIDCNLDEAVLEEVSRERSVRATDGACVVVGYNAFSKGSWGFSGSKTQLLPIGGGLLVTRVNYKNDNRNNYMINGCNKGFVDNSNGGLGGVRRKSHWVVKVDKCTGEEHVFRVRTPPGRVIQA